MHRKQHRSKHPRATQQSLAVVAIAAMAFFSRFDCIAASMLLNSNTGSELQNGFFPCREINLACQKPAGDHYCQLMCANNESKYDCRIRRKCDLLPTKHQIHKCKRECKEASPNTCRVNCMSSENRYVACGRSQSDCWEIANNRNSLSEQGLHCGETYGLCKEMYENSCAVSCLELPTEGEQKACKDVCEQEGSVICRPGKKLCKEAKAVNRGGGVQRNSCISLDLPVDCFCKYEVNRIGYSTAQRKTFEAWCSTRGGEECGFYKCPECGPIGIPPDECYLLGPTNWGGGAYQQKCPPGACGDDVESDQVDSEMIWCTNGPESTPCAYKGQDCIPKNVFHPAQCEHSDGTIIDGYECPQAREGCEECNAVQVECYIGFKTCHYCSWDCIPTGTWPEEGFGDNKNLYCDEVAPIPFI